MSKKLLQNILEETKLPHQKISAYSKLSPKEQKAVDTAMSVWEKNPQDPKGLFKAIDNTSKKFGVKAKDIKNFFSKAFMGEETQKPELNENKNKRNFVLALQKLEELTQKAKKSMVFPSTKGAELSFKAGQEANKAVKFSNGTLDKGKIFNQYIERLKTNEKWPSSKEIDINKYLDWEEKYGILGCSRNFLEGFEKQSTQNEENEFKQETKDIITSLNMILKENKGQRLLLQDETYFSINPREAKMLIDLHENLNQVNRVKMINNIRKDKNSITKLIEFSKKFI